MDLKFIEGGNKLSKLLIKLTNKSDEIYFATAWASSETDFFKVLLKNKNKIKCGVVGLNFFRTDPKVLEEFIEFDKVNFILQDDGVFHPKVTCFYSEKCCDLVIGSANLTKGAFKVNTELSLHLSSKGYDTDYPVFETAIEQIKDWWKICKADNRNYKNQKYIDLYRIQHRRNRVRTALSSNPDGNLKIENYINIDFNTFYNRIIVVTDKQNIRNRLKALELTRNQFANNRTFEDLTPRWRKAIAGLVREKKKSADRRIRMLDDHDVWGWFGGMSGNGIFVKRANTDFRTLSTAIEAIPYEGDVTYHNYSNFVKIFMEFVNGKKIGLGPATRLLAYRRPDNFICMNRRNKENLKRALGFKPYLETYDYDRYWNEVILKIRDSEWWNSPQPSKSHQRRIWKTRVAMFDALLHI